jgi:hypothetical protein
MIYAGASSLKSTRATIFIIHGAPINNMKACRQLKKHIAHFNYDRWAFEIETTLHMDNISGSSVSGLLKMLIYRMKIQCRQGQECAEVSIDSAKIKD